MRFIRPELSFTQNIHDTEELKLVTTTAAQTQSYR